MVTYLDPPTPTLSAAIENDETFRHKPCYQLIPEITRVLITIKDKTIPAIYNNITISKALTITNRMGQMFIAHLCCIPTSVHY